MQIMDNLFNPQIDRLSRALRNTSERQTLLTENLANVNTPGYKRKDVAFGIELDNASSGLGKFGSRFKSAAIGSGSLRMDGNNVDLEREVAGIAETETRYQMLTEMTYRYFNGLKTAIREGR